MPNRVIKESIDESEGLSECSLFAIDLYKRLICYADDYGRFNADTTIMRARLYPRELLEVSEEDIVDGLSELAGVGKVGFYTPIAFNQFGKKGVYGAFPNWSEHQRVRDSKTKCPEPDDTSINDWYLRRFIPMAMRVRILERDNFKCQLCGKYVTTSRDAKRFAKLGSGLYHLDHIVPVLQGGRATDENLRVSCPDCNLKRHKTFSFHEILEETLNATTSDSSPQFAAVRGETQPTRAGAESESESNPNPKNNSTELPNAPPVLTMTLNDGTEYGVSQSDIDEWQEAFPNVDVVRQLHAMKLWCKDNPKKRKTKNGIRRFITNWLDREQNRGSTPTNVPYATQPSPPPPDASTYRRDPTEEDMRKLRQRMGYE